jgi:hypothetical protein
MYIILYITAAILMLAVIALTAGLIINQVKIHDHELRERQRKKMQERMENSMAAKNT